MTLHTTHQYANAYSTGGTATRVIAQIAVRNCLRQYDVDEYMETCYCIDAPFAIPSGATANGSYNVVSPTVTLRDML
jgi:hypothetical protein